MQYRLSDHQRQLLQLHHLAPQQSLLPRLQQKLPFLWVSYNLLHQMHDFPMHLMQQHIFSLQCQMFTLLNPNHQLHFLYQHFKLFLLQGRILRR